MKMKFSILGRVEKHSNFSNTKNYFGVVFRKQTNDLWISLIDFCLLWNLNTCLIRMKKEKKKLQFFPEKEVTPN